MNLMPSLWLFVLISLPVLAQADTVDSLLDKMMQAMKTHNYEGTLVIRQADKLQAMHIKHGIDKNGIWESIESLSGEQRLVIKKQGKVTTIFPARHLVTVSLDQKSSPFHPPLPENRDSLKQLYNLTLDGQDRVAGQAAQILKITPKDKYRYGYKLWLGKGSGLLLKCDLIDEQNKVIEQLMYSELHILKQPPESDFLLKKSSQYRVVNLDQGRKIQQHRQWQAKSLPEGFMLTTFHVKPSSHNKGFVQHIVYSDGMASVSVFIEKHMPEKMSLKGISKMGAVNVFGIPINNHHVTVIGEVPAATVRLIGESVQQIAWTQ